MVCPKCGASIDDDSNFCSACGTPVSMGQDGLKNDFSQQEIAEAGISSVPVEIIGHSKPQATKSRSKKALFIVVIALVVIIVGVVLFQINKGPNFKKLYDEYCRSIWSDIGSDGSYLSIDTHPFDEDDNGLAYPDAYNAIKKINAALNLPESLINDMGTTTSADGKQSESFDKINVIVTWKYHPDKGLEVTYKKLK